MPGAGAASRGTSIPTSSGASRGAGAGASGGKNVKKRSFIGKGIAGAKKAGSGLLGAIGSALGAPQQVMLKVTQGGLDVAQGRAKHGLKEMRGAVGEMATLGQAKGDIDIAETFHSYDSKTKTFAPKKLPKGLNTAGMVVADPLNFVTFGAGAAAKTATSVATKTLGKEAAERLATQGFKKGLTEAEKTAVRNTFLKGAEEAGAKNAAKTAERQITALTKRGRGGVSFHVPFTDIGGTAVSGKTVGKVNDVLGVTAAKKVAKTSAPGSFMRSAFVPGAAVADKHGVKASDELLGAIGARSASQANDVNDVVTRWNSAVKDFVDTAPKGVKFTAADDTFIHQALESGDIAAAKAARPELSRLIDTGDALRRQTDASLRESGALPNGVTVADDGAPINVGRDMESFMHRELTPEALKALGKAERGALYEGKSLSGSMTPGSTKARVIAPEYSAKEINEAIDTIHQGGKVADRALHKAVAGIAKKLPPGTKLYRESAVVSLVTSGADAAKAASTAKLMDDISGITDEAGEAILKRADGTKAPEGWVSFDIPKLGTFHAPPEVKNEITKFMSVIGQDDAIGKFTQYMTQWNRWWKGQVTASLPGGVPFASRNARSNVMLTFADGMPPTYFAKGGAFQNAVRKVVKNNAADIADEGLVPVMKRELGERNFKIWQAAREQGVIGDGFYNIDLTDAPILKAAGAPKSGGKVKRGVRAVAGSHGTLAVKGRAMNQAVEQHARMSHFLYSIDRLGDLGEAAARTNTVLFDYGKLTPFEQKVVKQILPFYTFMRKNVPGQFKALIENPTRITGPEKLSQAVSQPLDEDAPEYQKRLGAHVSGLPGLAGLITTPERPFQAAVNSFEPAAQMAGALLPGDQGAIEPGKGTPQALRSLVSMAGGGPISLTKALVEEGTGKSAFTGYNLTEDERRQRLLATAYPALGRAPTLTGRLPSTIQKQGTKKKAKISTLAQIAAMLGIKLEPSDKK